ncbi:MAG: hypothetical protein KIT09_05435 [Bryobacteraceae bacterium]|nr:hypothetical protein [Bryobacteraceae bacterium]
MTALALALAAAIGWLAVRILLAGLPRRPRWMAATLEIALGIGAGVAITSSLFFVLLAAGAAQRGVVLGVEAALLSGLAAIAWRRRASHAEEAVPPPPSFRWNWLLALAAGAGIALIVATQVDTARASPHGNWDAFATWNLRAKFLLAPDGQWRNAASELLTRTHPEYPLLLPGFVARTWRLAGEAATPAAPLGTAWLFGGAAIAALAAALALVRGAGAAWLGCLVLFSGASYIDQISWQYADIPLSVYILATTIIVLLSWRYSDRPRAGWLALAGALAGSAAWAKNEGLAFFVLSLACYALITWRSEGAAESIRRGRWWLAGGLPFLALLAAFHLFLAPSGAALRGQTSGAVLARLADPGRYAAVAGAFVTGALEWGRGVSHPAILLGILAVALRFDIARRHRPALWFGAATLALMMVAYVGIYLASPDELSWLLGGSLQRLYAQLWPAAVLLAFVALGAPSDPPPAVAHAKPHKAAAKKARSKR